MKFKIEKGLLNNALTKVSKAINARSVIPVLSGVLIEVNESGLSLTGSDSNISIKSTVPVNSDNELEVELEGEVILPAKELTAIVKSMPTHIEMEQKGSQIIVSSGKSKFTLNSTEANEYPKVKDKNEKIFDVNAEELSSLIRKTAFATSKMETRPILMGVHFSTVNGRIGAVATDSHRLSRVFGKDADFEGDFVIPATSIKEIPTLFKDGDITVSKSENNVSFRDEETFVLVRLLTGSYPEIERLIPTDYSTSLTIDRTSFLGSLERSKILSADQVATFELSDKKGGIFQSIILSTNNNEVGKSQEEIIVDSVDGDELTISFNAAYVIEALKSIDSETVVFEFSGDMKPFVIKPISNTEDALQLVLPIRKF